MKCDLKNFYLFIKMTKKSIQLSSSGLKNIVLDEKDFIFIFGKEKIHMNNYLAEFISPKVSHLHHSDKTINSINISCPKEKDIPSFNEIFSEDIVDIIHQISIGSSVEITEDQSSKMKFISIFLGNEELYKKLDDLYPNKFNQSDIISYIERLMILHRFSSITSFDFDVSSTIDFISNNFYLIDISNILQLPKEILYTIISNKKLRIESEDSFFDFINKYIENNPDISEEEEISFLNEIKIENLSDDKFTSFLEMINPYKISSNLWHNLCLRIESKETKNLTSDRYSKEKQVTTNKKVDNINNDDNIGIIAQLMKSGQKNSFQITASSVYDSTSYPQNLISSNGKLFFSSKDKPNSWVKFDFKNKKVQLRSYSITSGPFSNGFYHPKSWVIEGSNGGDDEWVILDVQKNYTEIDGVNITKSFEIKKSDGIYYKFIRLRQIGKTSSNDNYLVLSHIEFYGLINDS